MKRSHRFICHLVFNSEQTEGLERFLECRRSRIAHKPLESAELIVRNMPNPPLIRNIPWGPSYCPVKDEVSLPSLDHFLSAEEYYCTLFHELVHSTAQPERLGRGNWISTLFNESVYSQEELVAEMGAAMLCALAGIEPQTLDNSAAYIGHWLEELDNDKRMLYFAAIHASRAFNFIARRQGSCLAA